MFASIHRRFAQVALAATIALWPAGYIATPARAAETILLLTIKNETRKTITYEMRYSKNHPVHGYSVAPGETKTHYFSTPNAGEAVAHVRFDSALGSQRSYTTRYLYYGSPFYPNRFYFKYAPTDYWCVLENGRVGICYRYDMAIDLYDY